MTKDEDTVSDLVTVASARRSLSSPGIYHVRIETIFRTDDAFDPNRVSEALLASISQTVPGLVPGSKIMTSDVIVLRDPE